MSNFESQVKLLLRSSEQQIEAEDLAALKAIRAKAIEQPLKGRFPAFLTPTAGMITASLVAFVLITSPLPDANNNENSTAAEASEFYEDLDFYSWLASNENGFKG